MSRPLSLALLLLAIGAALSAAARPRSGAVIARPAPAIASEVWLNSEPLSAEDLRGKVVLVEFWTFGCWNCHNVEPYVKAWHERYAGDGLVIIAVHTPEFESEKRVERVRDYLAKKGIRYAVPIDNDHAIWKSFGNRYWPAFYLIDRRGQIRHVRVGEGGHAATESAIQRLLAEPAGGPSDPEPRGPRPGRSPGGASAVFPGEAELRAGS